MVKIRTKVSSRGGKSAHENVSDVQLPANIEINLVIGSRVRKIVLAITKDGVYNFGDPDDLLSKWEK